MSLYILTTDTNLIIRSWDANLEKITGIKEENVYGNSLLEIVPELQEQTDFFRCIESILTNGINQNFSPNFSPYLISCPPTSSSIYFDKMQQKVIFSPLKEGEKIKGIIMTIKDITPEKEEEKRFNLELELAQKEQNNNHNVLNLQDLDNQNWFIRQQIVKKLIHKEQPEITAELIDLFRQEHRNPNILNSVIQALTLSKIDPIPALIQCLQEPDHDLRIYSALTLGERQDQRAIPYLIQSLDDPDQNVKFHAIEALGKLHAKQAVEYLIKIAKSEDFFLAFSALDSLMKIGDQNITDQLIALLKNTLNWEIRKETVDVLTLRNTPELTQELLHLLREQHQNPNILNSVLQVLALSNIDPVPALIQSLQDSNADVRLYTALALGERGDPRAIQPLICALNDENINVRYHAIDALGHLRATEAVGALLEIALETNNFFLAFPAIDALLRIEDNSVAPQLIPLLNHELLGTQVAETLGQLGDSLVIPSLVKALNNYSFIKAIALAIRKIYERYHQIDQEGAYILELIAQNIEPIGQENLLKAMEGASETELKAIALILSSLEGEKVELALVKLLPFANLRSMIIEPLVKFGAKIIPLIIPYLYNQDLETRQIIVSILGRIGNSTAVPELTNLLNTEPELILYITTALAQIGDHQAFDTLISLLGYPDVTVRLGAISALNSLGHPQMPQKLLSLLVNPDHLVRESAVKIAGYFAFTECVDALLACVEDENENVRLAAVKHLPYLDQEDQVIDILIKVLKTDTPKVRSAAIQALGELNPKQSIPYILEGLEDQNFWVRYHCIKALGQSYQLLETQTIDHTLIQLKLLSQHDPTEPVKAIATEVMGKLGQEQVIPLLTTLVKSDDEEVARAAIRALGQIESVEAVPPLLTALNSENSSRRMDALQAFRERGGTEAEVSLQWMISEDPDQKLVLAAIESLSQMATPEAIQALLDLTVDPSNREICINTLARRHKEQNFNLNHYIDQIAKGLNHNHSTVRCATIEILKRLKHPYASEYLIKALEEPDSNVRLSALNALIYLGNRACLNQLSQLAKNDPSTLVRRAAQKGLLI